MTSLAPTQAKFDFTGELHKTMVQSLSTTFGLDFLLFEDKKGGDVDTIHNVRQGTWATNEAKQDYENRGAYNGDEHHKDKNYIQRGRSDKKKQQAGELIDEYRGTAMKTYEERDLDHIISAHEIHNDAGRILAGLSGVELASQDSNLQSTNRYINKIKRKMPMQEFVDKLPHFIQEKEKAIAKNEQKLKTMPNDTPQQRKKIRDIESDIRKDKGHIETLKEYEEKKDLMLKADKEARNVYNEQINVAYYTSSRFFKNTTKAAATQGFKMGIRQAVGLILAEIWFELKEAIPSIIKKCCENFSFEVFWQETKNTLSNIFERVKLRFKDILQSFKDSFIGGILSSITTTVLNIFFTSSKLLGKLIRESWNNLVQVVKLLVFNPQNLAFGDLMKEITRIILASISTILGVMLNQHLVSVLTFPFGTEIAAFLSALFSGLLMVGVGYFIDYSPIMNKVWNFLNTLKSKYQIIAEHIQAANAELDRYAQELARLEFNLNPHELEILSYNLSLGSSEIERSFILKKEIERRNIALPFEMGNTESTKQWLKNLKPKN